MSVFFRYAFKFVVVVVVSFQALDDCLKYHLGDDIITSINELTSQVKIKGIHKDEVVTILKQLGY